MSNSSAIHTKFALDREGRLPGEVVREGTLE